MNQMVEFWVTAKRFAAGAPSWTMLAIKPQSERVEQRSSDTAHDWISHSHGVANHCCWLFCITSFDPRTKTIKV